MNRQEICRSALETFGADIQIVVAIEELSELQKELCKYQRGGGDIAHIAEEIADVKIMIAQMEELFECEAFVESWTDAKLQRLKELISLQKVHEQIMHGGEDGYKE